MIRTRTFIPGAENPAAIFWTQGDSSGNGKEEGNAENIRSTSQRI